MNSIEIWKLFEDNSLLQKNLNIIIGRQTGNMKLVAA